VQLASSSRAVNAVVAFAAQGLWGFASILHSFCQLVKTEVLRSQHCLHPHSFCTEIRTTLFDSPVCSMSNWPMGTDTKGCFDQPNDVMQTMCFIPPMCCAASKWCVNWLTCLHMVCCVRTWVRHGWVPRADQHIFVHNFHCCFFGHAELFGWVSSPSLMLRIATKIDKGHHG